MRECWRKVDGLLNLFWYIEFSQKQKLWFREIIVGPGFLVYPPLEFQPIRSDGARILGVTREADN